MGKPNGGEGASPSVTSQQSGSLSTLSLIISFKKDDEISIDQCNNPSDTIEQVMSEEIQGNTRKEGNGKHP